MAHRPNIRAPFMGVSSTAIALSLVALAAPAMAQDAAPAQEAEGDNDNIVVLGFRQALESATAAKKERDQIVEAVSAEDIARLPDASIAESIARLPGLTSQRISGRSSAVSIRGFAPDFSTTLLNGREQTSTGDNRAVEYDQYPSEVINQVLVYKTAQSNLIGQGLAGTVDLRTIRPLEYGRRTIAVGGRGTYTDAGKLNSGSREYGYRVFGTYVDQFADDTIGVALSANYLDEPYQIEEFNAWGYADAPGGAGVIGGSKSYVTSTRLKRLGLQGTLQWRPSPNWTSTFDGFYSDFDDPQIKRGIELPLGFANPVVNPVIDNGFVTSGRFDNVEGVVRNDSFQRKAKLYSFGFNQKYEGDSGWNAMLDISYSRTDRRETILESYAGTGYGGGVGALDSIGFQSGSRGTVFSPTLDYSNPALILLTDPQGWGGANVQAGYFNDREVKDEIQQYRVEVERELGGFLRSVQFGLNYTKRQKSLTPDEALLQLSGGILERPIPQEFVLSPTNLSYLGLGPMLSYDPAALLAGGIYTLTPNTSRDVPAKAFSIDEDVMTAYLQGNINQQLGTSVLTGNIGVQFVSTVQRSDGFVATDTALTPIADGDSYIDVLPTLNLSLRTDTDWVFRIGAGRQMMRARLDDMRVALSYGVDLSANGGLGEFAGSQGSPRLRPIRANAFDATIEKYFGTRGYLALQGFYKDLKSFVYNAEIGNFDFSPFPPPAGQQPPTAIGRLERPINGEGGSIYGAELAGTLPLGEFVGALDGFGITGGVSYTETEISPTPGAPSEDIPGYSRWVANGTAFFEKWGFNVRGSVRYRSTFVGELSGFGANRVRRRALDETIVDAQIGYDFQPGSSLEGVSLFVQGQNLTDEPFVTVDGRDDRAIIDYQRFGRRFLAGATFRF
ncbi:TonB-dependent receptor [Sphingomonas sp.]